MPKRIAIGRAEDFPPGQLHPVGAEGTLLLVAQIGGRFCAVHDECAHLLLPLRDGALDGETIICPWHQSRFDFCTGENLDWAPGAEPSRMPKWTRRLFERGQKPRPLRTCTVIEEDSVLYIELQT
ncbi:MAG: Rieske 2Fe-2S domain-containing protein [Chloroflexi bacterium]|nr:Rieske 2Fe-2S domain-containing protein [Chloroflexota bacterium]